MIKPKTLDLREADGYAVTDADLVIESLKKDRRYMHGLMYRGFDGRKLEILLKHGTDDPCFDSIFCCHEEDLNDCGIESTDNALIYANGKGVPALAVYDGSKLTMDDCTNKFRFVNPKNKLDALVAVYLLKW